MFSNIANQTYLHENLDVGPFTLNEAYNRLQRVSWLYPSIITIHPSDFCQHRCPWCWFSRSKHNIDMSRTIPIIAYLVGKGANQIVVSGGGEPLCHPSIDVLIDYLAQLHDVEKRLYTNGDLLTENPLCAEAFDFIRVSIDSGGAERYAETHRTDESAYNKLLEKLARLSERTQVGVSAIVSKETADCIVELIRDCTNFGISSVLLKPQIDGFQRYPLPRYINDLVNAFSIVQVRNTPAIQKNGTKCGLPQELAAMNIVLAADSFIYPCCHMSGSDWAISRVNIANFKDAVSSSRHKDILNRYAELPHPCRVHDVWATIVKTEEKAISNESDAQNSQ